MSILKEPGKRSIQLEVEVPGTPEEVWQAIATGNGTTAWFTRAEIEEREGGPEGQASPGGATRVRISPGFSRGEDAPAPAGAPA